MLIIGRIMNARRQHRHHRPALADLRRTGRQRPAQHLRIIAHRPYTDLREQFREHLQHRLPVLQHVGDAGRRAGIILQNEELVLAGADKVDADDMRIDAAGRRHADHLRQEGIIVLDQLHRHAARPQDFLAMVDIVQEGIDRAHPLLDPARQLRPFARRNDARHDVKRNQPLVGICRAIDVEGDARAPEEGLRLPCLAPQPFGRFGRKPLAILRVRRARPLAAPIHLVKKRRCFSHVADITRDSLPLNGVRVRGCLQIVLPDPPSLPLRPA